MAEKIMMTALSPTMEEGTIVSWSKKEGDTVAAGDVLCEVETDKATMDYESTQEGTLLKIVRGEGTSATVGQTIGILGESGEDVAEMIKEAEAEAAGGGPSDEEAAPAEPDGTKATVAAAAGSAGQPAAPPRGADQQSPSDAAEQRGGSSAAGDGQSAVGPSGDGSVVKASPLARRLAHERGVDLTRISGSGPGGRVVKADVENYVPTSPGVARAGGGFAQAAAMQPGENQSIPVAGKRAVIAKRLAESKFSAPHYYLKSSVAMDGAMAARSTLNKEIPEKAGFNAFLMKFVAEALKRHPEVNASWQGDQILQFGSIDIGLAVDLGNGLITPIVRNCGNKGVVTIDQELKSLIQKAGDGKLAPEEYAGATFTISNLGSFGIEEFTAIINPPGAAILAVGEIKKTVVVNEDDEIDVAQIMKMTLSCDHRVIDGATGGRFLYELKRIIENPVRALY
ncbi:MAG: pyruvate dehydrogenase complex dihydrolipoamide acetyltransferase [Spirochaetales bacterium]